MSFFLFIASPVATIDFLFGWSDRVIELMNYVLLLPRLRTHATTIRFSKRLHNVMRSEVRGQLSTGICKLYGTRGGAVGWGTALQVGRSRVRFPMVSLEFFIDIILPVALGPGVDSASKRNEYQEYFLEGKGGRCVGLTTLPPSCADCLEIWKPQPPGNLRASPRL